MIRLLGHMRAAMFVALSIACAPFDVAGLFTRVYAAQIRLTEAEVEYGFRVHTAVYLTQTCESWMENSMPREDCASVFGVFSRDEENAAFTFAIFAVACSLLVSPAAAVCVDVLQLDVLRKIPQYNPRVFLVLVAVFHALLQITTCGLELVMYKNSYLSSLTLGPSLPLYLVASILAMSTVAVAFCCPSPPVGAGAALRSAHCEENDGERDRSVVMLPREQTGPIVRQPTFWRSQPSIDC